MTPSPSRRRALGPALVVTVSLSVSLTLAACSDSNDAADPQGGALAGTGGTGGGGASSGAAGAGHAGKSGCGPAPAPQAGAAGAARSPCAGPPGTAGTGGAAGQSSQAGAAQGGSDAGGASQGGSDAGGAPQGGSDAGGAPQGGSDAGGAAQGGSTAGGSQGGTTAAGGSAAGVGGAGAGNHPSCPTTAPQMDDACVGDLVCQGYSYGFNCGPASTISCKAGRWKIAYGSTGFCNPPTPCADDEPDPDASTCPNIFIRGGAQCRYARSTCFVYTSCDQGTKWVPGVDEPNRADSCCPDTQPNVGDPCTEEAILCGWGSPQVALVCRSGAWAARP